MLLSCGSYPGPTYIEGSIDEIARLAKQAGKVVLFVPASDPDGSACVLIKKPAVGQGIKALIRRGIF
ncbi:MAG: hypothetical protein CL759_06765 [Chloroflexi bacterium]|nr:hypothetical protein [Chloroflexota bacterium]|tara:strand:- start:15 stop:215 length:201 start_codon:yes stop_codon:yes gene_type:complete